LKSTLLVSLNDTVMVEPTVVVAMAAGLASVGAAIELKLTPLRVGASLLPPHAVTENPAAASAVDSGSMGAPAKNFNSWRRDAMFALFIKMLVGMKVTTARSLSSQCESLMTLR
jgi:hypothetical protein